MNLFINCFFVTQRLRRKRTILEYLNYIFVNDEKKQKLAVSKIIAARETHVIYIFVTHLEELEFT